MAQGTWTEDERGAIGAVLGRTPSGLFILTAGDGQGRETGMLASWVQQASFDPPMVTVAVNRERYLHEWLRAVPRLVLNLVGDGDKTLLKQFGRGFAPGEEAFDGVPTGRSASDLPVLTSALGHLEGVIAGELEAGDHVVYLVEVTGGAAGDALVEGKPWVHIRKSGFGY